MLSDWQPTKIRFCSFCLVPVARKEEIDHLLAGQSVDRLSVDLFAFQLNEAEAARDRITVSRSPVASDNTLNAICGQAFGVMVAFVGVALFDKDETACGFRLLVKLKHGMPGRARSRKRVQHDTIWAAPELDNLLEQLERLDGLEIVALTDDGV